MNRILLLSFFLTIAFSGLTQAQNIKLIEERLHGLWKIADKGTMKIGEDGKPLLISSADSISVAHLMTVQDSLPIIKKLPKLGNKEFFFKENNVCLFMSGFHNQSRETEYKIYTDMMQILDRGENKWRSYEIASLSADSLLLITIPGRLTLGEKQYELFTRVEKPALLLDFDDILIRQSPCFGSCPSFDILVRKTGEIIFEGGIFTQKKGLNKGQIDSTNLQGLMNGFRYVDFDGLYNRYYVFETDRSFVDIYFLKNNEIIRHIYDYGNSSPIEFQWAIQPFRYLESEMKMEKIKVKKLTFEQYVLDNFGITIKGFNLQSEN